MARCTGNTKVIAALQDALTAFLDDHRRHAQKTDPEWMEGWKGLTPEEQASLAGCDCKDCQRAGELLGSI
jgi:hypothetical protein